MKLYCGTIKGTDWDQTERIQQYVEAGGLLTLVTGNTEEQFKKCATLGKGECAILIGQNVDRGESESPLFHLLRLQSRLADMKTKTLDTKIAVKAVLLDVEGALWDLYMSISVHLSRAFFPAADIILYRNGYYSLPPVKGRNAAVVTSRWAQRERVDLAMTDYAPITEETPTPRFYLQNDHLWAEAYAYAATVDLWRSGNKFQGNIIPWISCGMEYRVSPSAENGWAWSPVEDIQAAVARGLWLRDYFGEMPEDQRPSGIVLWPNPFHSDAAWATFETLAGWRQQS